MRKCIVFVFYQFTCGSDSPSLLGDVSSYSARTKAGATRFLTEKHFFF